MSIKVKVGDVFYIPIDSERNVVGQIVSDYKGELFCVIYDLINTSPELSVEAVDCADIILFAITLDAKLWHGHWPIIGNRKENLNSIPKPKFKIETLTGYKVEDLTGQTIRRASKLDKAKLAYKTVVAPIRLEKAVKAYYGLEKWAQHFDELKATYLDLH